MAKKSRMGRNLNALLGGATRTRVTETSNDAATGIEAEKAASTERQPAQQKADQVSSSPESTQANNPASAATNRPATIAPASDSTPTFESATKTSEAAGEMPATNAAPESSATPAVTTPTTSAADTPSAAKPSPGLTSGASPTHSATPSITPGKATELQADSHPSDRLRMLGVDQITRGMYQPRRHFDQDLLQELADSIKAQGLIQPILVRAYGGKFELIAGERRWRASQLAGITDIPAIVRDMDDQSVAAVSLIENIQRADLNPLEEAQALERLCGEFSMTHQQVAEAVGRSRVAVTNLMRLLELHDDVKTMVDNGELDMGHARALLGAPRTEQSAIAKRIVQQGLTVRAVEKLVKDMREGKSSASEPAKPDPNIEALGQKLGKLLGAPVSIKHQQSGSGKLEISYSSIDELEGILSHIK